MFIVVWGSNCSFNFYDWGGYMSFLKAMFNSVARTFGRILAYALIGMAIYFIASRVNAQPQYRMSDLSNEWGSWTNISIGDTASGSTNITTNWGSYIQIKDTTTMEANKTYNLNISMKIEIQALGDRELFSSIVPYIYNGSTLTEQSLCTISGTKSDSTTSGILAKTTHIYNASINCVGLKGTGYYPYFTIRFRADTNTLISPMKLTVNGYNFQVGSDSTDSINIMNNQNQNTQSIIDADNQNTESIINNQNENTTQVIEALENQNKVCSDYNLYFSANTDNVETGWLNNSGQIDVSLNDYYTTSDYIKITKDKEINMTVSSSGAYFKYCLYDNNKTYISCTSDSNATHQYIPTDDGYLRFAFYKTKSVILTGTYCYDYREKETEQNEEINNNLKAMLTIFSDDTSVSDSSINTALNGIELADDTPMTNILMFPVLIFSYFNSNMSNTCSSVSLGSLYGHEITLPCIDIQSLIGSTLYNIIDLFMLFYMLYNFCHFLIGFFESSSELNNPFEHFFVKGADTNG